MALQLAKGRASLHSGRGLIPREGRHSERNIRPGWKDSCSIGDDVLGRRFQCPRTTARPVDRSEEHTSELQSHSDLVCRLLLEKKKKDEDDSVIQGTNKRM